MATMITIGNTSLNLDQVTEIDDKGSLIRVFYAVGLYAATDERQELAYSEFRDDEADLLRWWIQQNATDVAKKKASSDAPAGGAPSPFS